MNFTLSKSSLKDLVHYYYFYHHYCLKSKGGRWKIFHLHSTFSHPVHCITFLVNVWSRWEHLTAIKVNLLSLVKLINSTNACNVDSLFSRCMSICQPTKVGDGSCIQCLATLFHKSTQTQFRVHYCLITFWLFDK